MTVSTFLTLLATFTVLTTSATQYIKADFKVKDIAYSGNLLATIVGCIMGIAGTSLYYLIQNIQFNAQNIAIAILMGPAVSLSAMGSYDKVKEAIEQLAKIK